MSSAAYLTGKVIRSPGPIIRQVDPKPGTKSLDLIVSGSNLDKDGVVTVGGTALPKDNIHVLSHAEGGAADINKQLVSHLRLTLVEPDKWTDKTPIVIVNSDGQRSEWPTPETPPQAALAPAQEIPALQHLHPRSPAAARGLEARRCFGQIACRRIPTPVC